MYERRFMQRLCYEHIFSIIFGAVKSMRSISPFISGLLIVFVLASSIGFTLIVHTCNHCGVQKIITALSVTGGEDRCCCGHDKEIMKDSHTPGEYVFSHDCCSFETEKPVTDQVVRTEVQTEIMLYLNPSATRTINPDLSFSAVRLFANDMQSHDGRDLMTMHCQILS
ncbi:MAG: hypothetical protein WCD55_13830 [Bacteroidales bacterium]